MDRWPHHSQEADPRFAFIDAEAFAGDKLLVTATAIFRIFEVETRK
jgi:hypothetical protein